MGWAANTAPMKSGSGTVKDSPFRTCCSQFGTLNNSDPNGFTYQGFSKFFSTDLRARYQFDRQWSAAFGIDNLNNYHYWNFHPYPQRTYSAELKFDL